MQKPAVILATALSTLALAGAVGMGVASAAPTPAPSASPSVTTSPSAPTTTPALDQGAKKKADKAAKKGTAKKGKRDLARRALHGEVTLGGKKAKVVDFQRGTVSAVSATSITVLSPDDFSATYVVDAKTKVRQAEEKAAIGDVQTGDEVRVVARKDGSTLTAKRITDRTK